MKSYVVAVLSVFSFLSVCSPAVAQDSCFRVDGVSAAGTRGVTIERPDGFRGAGLRRSYLVLEHRRSLRGSLGESLRRIKIPVTVENKIRLSNGAYGLAFTFDELASEFGMTSGSPAICASWEVSSLGSGSTRSDEVCFRMGGVVRDIPGTRAGTIGICRS